MFSKIKTLSAFIFSLCHMLQPLEPSWLLSSGYFSASKYLLHIWEPKLDTVFQMWPHKCQVEESNNFPSPAGCMLVNLAWYVVSLHYLKGAVLTLVQLFHWDPHVPFCRAVISLVSPQPIPLHGVFCPGSKTVLSAHSPACSRPPHTAALSSSTSATPPVSYYARAEGTFQLIQITEYVK